MSSKGNGYNEIIYFFFLYLQSLHLLCVLACVICLRLAVLLRRHRSFPWVNTRLLATAPTRRHQARRAQGSSTHVPCKGASLSLEPLRYKSRSHVAMPPLDTPGSLNPKTSITRIIRPVTSVLGAVRGYEQGPAVVKPPVCRVRVSFLKFPPAFI